MTRYVILDGDRTTSNGTVCARATATPFALNDRQIAHESDEVSCPACGTTGKIQCDGPRIPMEGPDGQRVALSDDLCICQCSPPPKLVASQQIMSIEV